MKVGAVFPQTEIGPDPASVRAYAEAAEELGYSHLAIFDHVLGADISNRPNWPGPYTNHSQFHEVFVLMGYLAAITTTLGLATSVLILPQRQTALVAKQAAEVDVLSGGRLSLGVGLGWNPVEYEALGEDFHTRGKRSEEQVRLLRELWTNELVTFEGDNHTVLQAGLNPMPVQRPIPLWFGGGESERSFRRIARLADGWYIPMGFYKPDDSGHESLERFRGLVSESGRDPANVGLEVRARMADGFDTAVRSAVDWAGMGATATAVNTMGAGYDSLDEHIGALETFMDAARRELDVEGA